MGRLLVRKEKPPGTSPGSVVYIGEPKDAPITITRFFYASDRVDEQSIVSAPQCFLPAVEPGVLWYNVDGVHDNALLQALGESFHLHPLVVEDIVNTTQRPKLEDYGDYIFVTMKMITYDSEAGEIRPEHVSFILGENYVISFQEDPGDVFDPVRNRIRGGKGRIRKLGSDYLLYALLDAIVDHYFTVLDELSGDIEEVEESIVDEPSAEALKAIHTLKRELIYLRRTVWPLREAVNALVRAESDLVSEATEVYYRDLYDHAIQVIDTTETLRDIVSGMLDVYLSSLSNKMNEVMKVLTVMSSIFIPLTFIAGVYGMNFEYMPELHAQWGYPAVMIFMAVVAGGLLLLFRRWRWI